MSRIIDLDAHEATARAATPGEWQWYGNTKQHEVYLSTVDRGRRFVMDFTRWGMAGAQPRFQIDHRMVALAELGKTEHPMGPRFEVPYRRQFVGIGHPDAQHIAANSPPATLAMISRIRNLERALHEALNYWSSDMPDPDPKRDELRAVADAKVVLP